MQKLMFAVAVLLFASSAAMSQSGTCSGMTVGQLTSLNGFVPFPSNNLWNTDISSLPVDANSANIINFIGSTVTLHPEVRAFTLISVWKLQRSRRDEARLHAALNEFNGLMPFWAAWTIDRTTVGISTVFTLGLRTSPRTITAFLERASDLLFKQLAVTSAFDEFLGFVLNGRSAQQLSSFRDH